MYRARIENDMDGQPSNADILEQFHEHARTDELFQDETRKFHGEQMAFKAETEGKLAELAESFKDLASKEDIKELKNFLKNIKIGEGIVKFSWNNMSKIGGLITFILGVYLFFKFGLVGLIAVLFGKS